ncbi:phosphotransferase [Mycobacterium sp. 2YAF39]|uniref:phosphotransferase n=1 Tax=Mycobacterium sp. 2YAF39 TaxID=3233033 RepID=UPI003F95D0F4
MTRPTEPVPTPLVVTEIAAGRPVAPVWVNELGGVTFAVDGGSEYVKVTPPRWAHHLEAEACRLPWAATYLRVPRVLGAGDGWLHTEGLPGSSAVDPRWLSDPRTAARAIGAGLALMHDALPVEDCPFGPPAWVTEGRHVDRLVVCHGDACAPNTLIDDDGQPSGHVDLGDLGVADRPPQAGGAPRAISVAEWSLRYNYRGDWRGEFFDAYGIAPDQDRMDHYLRLWEDGN